MAINHTELFTILGKYVKSINTFYGLLETTIQGGADDIFTVLENANLTRLSVNTQDTYDFFKADIVNWIPTIIAEIEELLTDRDYIIEQLPNIGENLIEVLEEIIFDMNLQLESVLGSLPSGIIDTYPNGSNYGETIHLGKSLINKIPMSYGVPPLDAYVRDTQSGIFGVSLLQPDSATIYVECVRADAEGKELFSIFSAGEFTFSYEIQEETPGQGPLIDVADNKNILTPNADMQSVTTGFIDGWIANRPGWDINTNSDFIWAGNKSVHYYGSEPAFISHKLEGLEHNKSYVFSIQHGKDENDISSSRIRLLIGSNDPDAIAYKSSKILVVSPPAVAAFPFDQFVRFRPLNLEFSLDESTNLDNVWIHIKIEKEDVNDYFSHAIICPTVWYAGYNWTIVRGSQKYKVGDRFSLTITHNDTGFGEFFRKSFGIQLPSKTSGETIPNSLTI